MAFAFILMVLAAQTPITLADLLKIASERDPEHVVAQAELAGAESAQDLARWTRWSPKLAAPGVFGMVPAARGDIFSSPDSPRDLDNWGPFWRTRIDFSWPLLTFGRLGSAERAANAAVASKRAKDQERFAAVADICARAYFGYLLGRDSL